MSDGGAQHITFGPFFDSAGALLPSIKVYHYGAGTTNDADMWSDENKATPVAQPFIGDTAGVARLFGDNIYKIVIHDENDNLIEDYTWDNVHISRDVEGVMRNGTSFPAVAPNNTWQMAVKKDGSDNFSELGVSDGSAFVVLVKMNAAGDTHIFNDITQNGNVVLDVTDMLDEDNMASNSAAHTVTQQSLVNYVGAYSNTGMRDIVRNLTVENNSGSPNSQVDIDADEVSTQDGTGGFQVLSSVNLTVDISVSGLNGLDTGAEAINTWYYLWAIAKTDGTQAGLLSISSTAPTMPSGYTFKALIGAIYNKSDGHLRVTKQRNNLAICESIRVLSNGSSAGPTLVDLSTAIPPIAISIIGNTKHLDVDVTDNAYSYVSDDEQLVKVYWYTGSSAINNLAGGGYFELIRHATSRLYYGVNGGASDDLDIFILGWRL